MRKYYVRAYEVTAAHGFLGLIVATALVVALIGFVAAAAVYAGLFYLLYLLFRPKTWRKIREWTLNAWDWIAGEIEYWRWQHEAKIQEAQDAANRAPEEVTPDAVTKAFETYQDRERTYDPSAN